MIQKMSAEEEIIRIERKINLFKAQKGRVARRLANTDEFRFPNKYKALLKELRQHTETIETWQQRLRDQHDG